MSKDKEATLSITRRFQFCAGHRVHGHESKCRHLHGHNYVAHVRIIGPKLDSLGRVIDFGNVKQVVGGWIDEHWDHAFIAYVGDEEALTALRMVAGQKLYVMQTNPTAENMAVELLRIANARLRELGLRCVSVDLEETENCSAMVIQ